MFLDDSSLSFSLCRVCIVLLLGFEELLYKGDFAVSTHRNCLFFIYKIIKKLKRKRRVKVKISILPLARKKLIFFKVD